MECPQCQAENREGRRFCAKCGAPLAITCPECSFANELDVDFCGGCGKALSTTPATRSDVPLKRETPEAERRQLTVMFCDLVGSTALAERVDPEELREVIRTFQEACTAVIARFEGFVSRYMGDGILVLFGYPQAHENDAERAVRAGLGIVDTIAELNAAADQHTPAQLAVRVGIATGLVVAGDLIGQGAAEEEAVLGETPNLAARLEHCAAPNTVVIAPTTRRLLGELFEYQDLGCPALEGFSKPIQVWQVAGSIEAESRFDATHAAGITPLVGREEEVSLLLKRWAQAKEGESQVVLLSGEVGIGKSRIVQGFRERLEAESHTRMLYYCSPFHQNSAFYPAMQQIERGLQFEHEDAVEQKLDKLDHMLGNLGLSATAHGPVLASLLSLSPEGRYAAPELAPEQWRKKTLESLVTVIEAMTIQQPVLVVLEDVQWIDPSTLELIGLLIEQLLSVRLLLVITFRPQFTPPWSGFTHVTALALNRLSRKESTALVTQVAGGKTLPDEVLDEIVARTDGIPLYTEELTKTVIESNLFRDEGDRYTLAGVLPPLAIPASLHDSLMARLDRLGAVKEIAQLAATLGRTFSHALLAAVSPLDERPLEDALAQLLEAELIYRRGLPPDVTYEFKHVLVQEVAYQSLLKSTRQHYHERIAQALEDQFPQTGETEPELLAHHYTEAHLTNQAIGYWLRAGKKALMRSAHLEAISHLTKGLELLKILPDTAERAKQELDLQTTLGPALMAAKGLAAPEVEQSYRRAQVLCQQVGEAPQLFRVLAGLRAFYSARGELQTAREFGEQCLDLAKQVQDERLLMRAHEGLGIILTHVGEFTLARAHLDRGIALYDAEKYHSTHAGQDPGVDCLAYAAQALWLLGYPDQAARRIDEALALAQELSHPFTLAFALHFAGVLHQARRERRAVQECADASMALANGHGFPSWLAGGKILQGWALATPDRGDKEVLLQIREGVNAWRATGGGVGLVLYLALLGDVHRELGEAEEGLHVLDEALTAVDKTGEHAWEAELHRLKGELLLLRSAKNRHEAEPCFNRAIEVARGQSAKSLELRAVTSLSRLWRDQGKRKEVDELT
jgi:class 3 adenylate cyclase/predicted ATPase